MRASLITLAAGAVVSLGSSIALASPALPIALAAMATVVAITATAAWRASTSAKAAAEAATPPDRVGVGGTGAGIGVTEGWPLRRRHVALAVSLSAPALGAEPVVGRASVIDGDTIEIRGTRFRLQGVDTPEHAQLCRDRSGKEYRCGQVAANALADKIGAGNVACDPITTDRYRRTVAICRLGAEDLNGWLVGEGFGIAYRRYSTAYVDREEAAKAARRGLWAGSFTPPWAWRKGERAMALGFAANGGPDGPIPAPAKPGPEASGTTRCAIKGNINRTGDHIYHVPGSRDYARTVITESDGERWFCSEAEAHAAGWRAPRG
ncbi:thermonuclease family protein [Methylobacterium longum]|uniref:Thermonuclease family protein n=1 Tax=Methylobacterium longum TaxID=767694 RepID=A0ABT8AXG2_9HYPH|nr:thermonuclease family protein [Methylobacterium longum]MDN3574581.1 thermonuclease family protein [Methylobacterium longum]GJE14845.1 hypothetical protein FOHLNKBM_5920 [Methylobacterium longum]